jgi:hypothetical protein
MIDKEAWDATYKKLCQKYLNMSEAEAEKHFKTAPDFDRGYTALWYITEELKCKFIERKRNVQAKT